MTVMAGERTVLYRFLLFSVGGVLFGASTDQIEGVAAIADSAELHWFHQEMGLASHDYLNPACLSVRTKSDRPYRIVIDSLEDIISVGSDGISPLPEPIEKHVRDMGLWGVVPRQGRMILLVDLERLSQGRGH